MGDVANVESHRCIPLSFYMFVCRVICMPRKQVLGEIYDVC